VSSFTNSTVVCNNCSNFFISSEIDVVVAVVVVVDVVSVVNPRRW
jgi:hypothetical protein